MKKKSKIFKYLLLFASLSMIVLFVLYGYMSRYLPFSEEEIASKLEKYEKTDDSILEENIIEDVSDVEKGELMSSSNILIIPSLGVEVGVFTDSNALEEGVWMMFSERSNPEKGGNIVISGHRFSVGTDIKGVRTKSPFFNIQDLKMGDVIIIIWEGDEYRYSMDEMFTVKSSDEYITYDTYGDILTIYTCNILGDMGKRFVVRAIPID